MADTENSTTENDGNFQVIDIDVKTESIDEKENNYTKQKMLPTKQQQERSHQQRTTQPMIKQQQTTFNGSHNNGVSLHECNRCEAMFRSKDLYEYHRKICYGGKDQPRYCKICGVRKESEWLMGKHLLEHCDIKNGKCLDCDWVSDKLAEHKKNPDPKVFNELMKDIGSHLNKNHMVKAEDLPDGVPPPRSGFRISPESLRCIECNQLQDDIKSLQEHLKVCFNNSKARFFICYCEAEFSDRTMFHHHINLFQCVRNFSASKLIPPPPTPYLKPDGKPLPNGLGNGLLKDNLKRSSPPKEYWGAKKIDKTLDGAGDKLGDLYPVNKKSKLEETSPSRSPDLNQPAMNGESGLRCDKCNISFKKLETYKVHKESYCESRHANVEAIQAARAEKQREREEMKLVNKERNKNRVALEADDNTDWRDKPYPCHDCSIGFESKKHYEAHKRNYCKNPTTDSANSNSPRSSSPNQSHQSAQGLLQVAMMLSNPALFNPAALLSQLNPASMLPNAQTLMKNQALTQALNQALKIQLQNGASTSSPLDLSSKKDENEESEGSLTNQAQESTSQLPTIAKIEEIEEIESADTRVSV